MRCAFEIEIQKKKKNIKTSFDEISMEIREELKEWIAFWNKQSQQISDL